MGDLMANFRIFVEKKPQFNIEAMHLLESFNKNLHLNLTKLRILNVYDIFNIDANGLKRAENIVFAEVPLDDLSYELKLENSRHFAVEPLPGQYDQRADSALQALNLLSINNPKLALTTGKIIILDAQLNDESFNAIKHFYINPLETQEKDLSQLVNHEQTPDITPVPIYDGFIEFNVQQLAAFRREHGLAMADNDLQCIQNYFATTEQRNPTETEIKVLDTYWSDHCRHTTFETHLEKIEFAEGRYQQIFQAVFENYLTSRKQVHGSKLDKKPVTMMDLATICGKQLRADGKLADVEISDEINACSLFVDVQIDGKTETWSLQFKNETHNHPTEIEPFGGASTCVGGAIRDPLSGRSYVYQAMRVSGAANPLEAIEDTLAGKLPQSIITTKAAHGFSSYGNQIGLATTHVKEIYHSGYKAKRMEVGMVVAAAPYANIHREQPAAGDMIILLGGATGRDGCGGATGSSKEHDINSAAQCSAEVQKGNPIVERKIQRLFRNPEVTQLIKKCNDFGAGGVSVAIGELADGLEINLDLVPTKYNGLSGTELAISESQERMAVVVAANDVAKFISLSENENLTAVVVASVTSDARVTMQWHGKTIVSLSREFLNTNGASSSAQVCVADTVAAVKFSQRNLSGDFSQDYTSLVQELNVCSQQGLSDMFDATIGASTILMPFGGKYQLTPSQVSAQKLPILSGASDAASVASFGYDPELSSQSPFHGAVYAVVDSVAKIVASGANHQKIRFSFQEYFERLGQDPQKWGKPFAALLGAYHAQQGFGLAAIGGKDSMSGTFNDLNVPPTLISFALAPTDATQIISAEFKAANNYVYVYLPEYDSNLLPDLARLNQDYAQITKLINAKKINAAYSIGYGGIAEAVFLMAIGNKLGVKYNFELALDLFCAYYGGLVLASDTPLDNPFLQLIATTNESAEITRGDTVLSLNELIKHWQAKLAPVFPLTSEVQAQSHKVKLTSVPRASTQAKHKFAKPSVIIPVFPGTNCEYDTERAFKAAGAKTQSMIFNNLSPQHIEQSIQHLAAQINQSQILMLPGGFSAGDEPDGSAKFIAAILRNTQIKDAVHDLLARDGLILGICNGFQALVKSGLLPYGEICELSADSPTLTHNLIGRHISRVVNTRICANHSPWLSSFELDEVHTVAMSHGEGRFVLNHELAKDLAANGQIACQYVDLEGNATLDGYYNPNGSNYAIEAITSLDGRILGKMGHSERAGKDLYKNIANVQNQDIFNNGVNYFG